MKKRGRPKGITQTVIGLPKKQERKNKCVPFDQKPSRETDLIMLEWFVMFTSLSRHELDTISGRVSTCSFFINRPSFNAEVAISLPTNHSNMIKSVSRDGFWSNGTVSSSCLDKLVNITLIKKYCTEVFIRLKFEIMCTYVIFAKAMPMKKSQVLCVVLALNGNTLHMQD
jgi:hypothetical protein